MKLISWQKKMLFYLQQLVWSKYVKDLESAYLHLITTSCPVHLYMLVCINDGGSCPFAEFGKSPLLVKFLDQMINEFYKFDFNIK